MITNGKAAKTKTNARARNRAGRKAGPVTLRRHQVMLDDTTVDLMRGLKNGNLSGGIREAALIVSNARAGGSHGLD